MYDVSVVGNTLQIETKVLDKKMGFAVADDANIVLIQDKSIDGKHDTDMDDIFEYSNGEKGLQKAVNRLNGNIKGHVSAILEGGVATSVIIWDLIENDVITGSGEYEDSESPAKAVADLDKLEITELVTVDGDVKTPISEALKAAGFKRVSKWDLGNDKVTAIDEDGNEVEFEITATEVEYFSVTVDDKVVEHVKDGEDAALTIDKIKGEGTGYILSDDSGSTYTYKPYAATANSIKTGVDDAVVIKTGYISITGANLTVNATGFDVKYQLDKDAAGGTKPTYAPVDSTLKVILTKETADLALDADTDADTVKTTAGDVADTGIVCSKASVVDSNADGVLTFKKDAGLKLEIGETITVSFKLTGDIKSGNAISVVFATA